MQVTTASRFAGKDPSFSSRSQQASAGLHRRWPRWCQTAPTPWGRTGGGKSWRRCLRNWRRGRRKGSRTFPWDKFRGRGKEIVRTDKEWKIMRLLMIKQFWRVFGWTFQLGHPWPLVLCVTPLVKEVTSGKVCRNDNHYVDIHKQLPVTGQEQAVLPLGLTRISQNSLKLAMCSFVEESKS